jgi:hypothetical protein
VATAEQIALYRLIRERIAVMADADAQDTCRDLYLFEELGGMGDRAGLLEALDRLIERAGSGAPTGWGA